MHEAHVVATPTGELKGVHVDMPSELVQQRVLAPDSSSRSKRRFRGDAGSIVERFSARRLSSKTSENRAIPTPFRRLRAREVTS